jgi:GT2 family glycosyltransferase
MNRPVLSVIVATRDRQASLRRTLRSLELAQQQSGAEVEVIVADNGSRDTTAEVLAAWESGAEHRRTIAVPTQGKSRAVNAALALATASLLAFTDDDVEVDPGWIAAILQFFADHPEYAAAMGRVRLPPRQAADRDLLDLIEEYRTIPLFDRGDGVCDLDELYGANLAVRRSALDLIGNFDERLGPGASGLSEDLDLARRLRQAGLRIGYMPAAIVYHEVDRTRLTRQYLREFQIRLGRSDEMLHPGRSCWRVLPRLIEAALAYLWASLRGARRQRAHAWGRMVRHADVFRIRWRGQPPGYSMSK